MALDREHELRAAAREVAGAVWGRLFLDLRAARLELEECVDAVRRDRAAALRDERALARQEALRADVARAGWCLGVLAAAEGHDLLHARRERAGLRWLIGLVAEARGLEVTPSAVELPDAVGEVGNELAVLGAWCALQASRSGETALRWRVQRDGEGGMLAFALGSGLRTELAHRCAQLDPGEVAAPRPLLRADELQVVWS